METFHDWIPLVIFLAVVGTLLIALFVAHSYSSDSKPKKVRRLALWSAALASGLVALVPTFAFAIPMLEDFRNPSVAFRSILIGAGIVWGICACAWVIAARCVVAAIRVHRSR